MSDKSIIHVGENSPEQVSFKLLQIVADVENKKLRTDMGGSPNADRKWILDTYAECLDAVKGNRIYARD